MVRGRKFWTPELVQELESRSAVFLKAIRGRGVDRVLRDARTPIEQLVHHIDALPDLPSSNHPALRAPHDPTLWEGWAAGPPRWLWELEDRRKTELSDAEILRTIGLMRRYLHSPRSQARIDFHQHRILREGKASPAGRESSVFLLGIARALDPSKGGRKGGPLETRDLDLLAREFREQLLFAGTIRTAYKTRRQDRNVQQLATRIYHGLKWGVEFGEYREDRTLSEEDSLDFLGQLCVVVVPPGRKAMTTRRPITIRQPKWEQTRTRAIVCAFFDVDRQQLDRAVRLLK
jgi:hypothetical protein